MSNLPDKQVDKLPRKRGRTKGATMILTAARRKVVMSYMLKGMSYRDIANKIMEDYNIGEASVELDYWTCSKELKQRYEKEKDHMAGRHVAMIYRLIDNWDGVDGNLQLKCIQELNKIAGIGKPDTAVQVNTISLNLDNLTVDELKKLLDGKPE